MDRTNESPPVKGQRLEAKNMMGSSSTLPVEQDLRELYHPKPKLIDDKLKSLWSQLRQDAATKLSEQEALARVGDEEDNITSMKPIPYTSHTWNEPVWPFIRPLECGECNFKTEYSLIYVAHIREHMSTWRALDEERRKERKIEPPTSRPPERNHSETLDDDPRRQLLCSPCFPNFKMPCTPHSSEYQPIGESETQK